MATLEITNNDTSGVIVFEPQFDDAVLLDASTVDYPAGTVLGRITASGKMTAYVSGAGDGSEVPLAVLTVDVSLTAATDYPVKVLVSGTVRRGKLSALGVGDITIAEADALRDYSIKTVTSTQLAELDNQ